MISARIRLYGAFACVALAVGLLAGCGGEAKQIPFSTAAAPARLALNVKYPRMVVPKIAGKSAAALPVPLEVVAFEIVITVDGTPESIRPPRFPVDPEDGVQEILITGIPAGPGEVVVRGFAADGTLILEAIFDVVFVPGQVTSNDVDFDETGTVDITPTPSPSPDPSESPSPDPSESPSPEPSESPSPDPSGSPSPSPSPSMSPPPGTPTKFVVTARDSSEVIVVEPSTSSSMTLTNLDAQLGMMVSPLGDVVVDAVSGNYVVAGTGGNIVMRVDQMTGTVNTSITGFSAPMGVEQNSLNEFLVGALGAIVRIDNAFTMTSMFAAIPMGGQGAGLGINQMTDELFFADMTNMLVYKMSSTTPEPPSPVVLRNTNPDTPFGIAVAPSGEVVIAESTPSDRIYLADPSTGAIVGMPVSLPGSPGYVTVDPATGFVVLTIPDADLLVEVDFVTGMANPIFAFPPGTKPLGIAVAP